MVPFSYAGNIEKLEASCLVDITGTWEYTNDAGDVGIITIKNQADASFMGVIDFGSTTKNLLNGNVLGNVVSFSMASQNSNLSTAHVGELSISSNGLVKIEGSLGNKNKENNWQMTRKIPDYASNSNQKVMIFQIGNSKMLINGVLTDLDASPLPLNGRIILPIRAIVEEMGGEVSWNERESQILIVVKNTTIKMWLNKNIIEVDGRLKNIDVSPTIINGRTMVPVRFVADNLPDCAIKWNENNQIITINY